MRSADFLSLFFLVLFAIPVINADVVSINSGGSTGMIINPSKYIEDFFSCVPTNCSKLGYECGSWSDACSKTMNCGSCNSGFTCTVGNCVADAVGGVVGRAAGGSGGGGAGTTYPSIEGIIVIPDSFNLPAVIGIESSAKISLRNIGETFTTVDIGLSGINKIVEFDETSLTLAPGETKILEFIITPPNEPGIYVGKILFTSQNRRTEVPFALNVNSEQSLFDIFVDISDKFKNVLIGNKIKGQITLVQAGLQENVDVIMEYVIKDFEGNTYLKESETLAVLKEKSYEKEFDTEELGAGNYLLGAEVIYAGGVATASSQFTIEEPKIKKINFLLIAELLVAIIILVILVFIAKNYKREKH
ncbi:MAG: hypothetical protein AABX28_00125 [Nanoarchaeota archaeon]